jgi:hypothetical protein
MTPERFREIKKERRSGILYAKYMERDIIGQCEYYAKHVSAMTAEGLHEKSHIAGELAHRDILVDELIAHIEAQDKKIEQLGEDKARLDWLETHDYFEATKTHDKKWMIVDQFTMDEVYGWDGRGDTLRQAIDNTGGNDGTDG